MPPSRGATSPPAKGTTADDRRSSPTACCTPCSGAAPAANPSRRSAQTSSSPLANARGEPAPGQHLPGDHRVRKAAVVPRVRRPSPCRLRLSPDQRLLNRPGRPHPPTWATESAPRTSGTGCSPTWKPHYPPASPTTRRRTSASRRTTCAGLREQRDATGRRGGCLGSQRCPARRATRAVVPRQPLPQLLHAPRTGNYPAERPAGGAVNASHRSPAAPEGAETPAPETMAASSSTSRAQ